MPTWTIRPGIAAYVAIISPDGREQSAVFLSHDTGVVVGLHDRQMMGSDIPLKVQAAVNQHFEYVFSLEHEHWTGPRPTPRAVYCDALMPWTVEVPDPPSQS